ncbi:tyrosine--tRNA ligase [Sphingorhabdus lutea]|uniref:Tyrosine--tRNA ligase n=1 Tax=Sphingorhabdus lutea TaxID=1913578 RepID=A0A1L3JC93_9SPHN|nr:tyrosine--tRNA ligase [Sphingorhabdus lutea]APG62755.1 tyrosine--tRNA ligase [Sphingorhabdus lutea]
MTQKYQSDLLNLLHDRGYIHQITDENGLDQLAQQQIVPGYIGFDATAPSLHIGSLVQIMMLRRLQQAGHKPIVIMGGGTTKIGDPTGKDESRKMLSQEDIDNNINSISNIFKQFLNFGDGPTDAVIIDNSDWLDKLEYLPFLRDVGRHFTINRMLSFESVKLRLDREQPLTFLEFNYMILQAYDYLTLAKERGCRLQMGGSDQWGNIVNGIELTRRIESIQAFGLTTPLITTADGGKMGKTANGAIWLNADQLSPYDYWQFWRNVQDADVGRFMRLFTDIPLSTIAEYEKLEGAEINDAKKILADACTAMAHGEDAAAQAADTAAKVFEQGSIGEDLPNFAHNGDAISLIDAMVELQLVASKKEARRMIAAGAARIEGEAITDENHIIADSGVDLKISAGKKKHGLLHFAK